EKSDTPITHQDVKSRSLSRFLMRWLWLLVFGYCGLIVMLVVFENYLVYPGSSASRGNWNPSFPFQEITFQSKDGTKLVGWFLPQENASETVLVCHGNAENVAQSSASNGRNFQKSLNANVFVFDYRGYGKSEGSPSEQGVLEDAESALAWLNKKTNTRPSDVVLVGHSIGGGPAVHLASKMGAKILFLQRTFGSIVEPAQSTYWFVPVNLLMSNRYPSKQKIKSCDVPLHQSHGDLDQIVPIWSGRNVFNNSPAKIKEFFVNEGRGHNDPLPVEYWNSIRNFLDTVNGIKSKDTAKIDDTETITERTLVPANH
ncbi:MAG: alpha/beta hydrolase, partial [Planctomycetota bacterium]